MKYITRIAPSPTGDMHIGTARTAYFNWLAAKASGGQFIFRIDDTDGARDKPEYEAVIHEVMDWLGLYADVLFRQSERTHVYTAMAFELVNKGKARILDNGAIALNFDETMPRVWIDEIAGEVKITDTDIKNSLQELILIRGDGIPTYHFATVIDDMHFYVNWIIRGHDHISNTCKHIAIYHALGAPIPKYSHVGLIFQDKKKMSKRDGAASVLHYKNSKYDADALLNFMLRMGWGPTVDDKTTAMIDRDKAIKMFLTEGKMRNAPSNMDLGKLDSFDRKYKAIKEKLNAVNKDNN